MKRLLPLLLMAAALVLPMTKAEPVSGLTISITLSGSPNEADKEGALEWIASENERRAANDQPPLPTGTNQQIATSLTIVMKSLLEQIHANNIVTAGRKKAQIDVVDLFANATQAKREEARALLLSGQKPTK